MDVVVPSKHPDPLTTSSSSPTIDQSPYRYRPITPPVVSARQSGANKQGGSRDSSWLELEPCREYLKDCCPRGEACRFAHPPRGTVTEGGKVTCCYDFLKDRCHREHCKYFHPPSHIKDRLVSAGKQFGAMMSGLYNVPQTGASPLHVSTSVSPLGVLASPAYQHSTDKLHICPDYLIGQCHQQLCALAHPEHYVRRSPDGTVTICRDYVRSAGCPREQCRFYHPPSHVLESSALSQPGFVTPQGVFLPAMLPAGFQQGPPVFYQPSSSPYTPTSSTSIPTSTFMYFPGSFPQASTVSPHMYLPVSYHGGPLMPSGVLPLVPSSLSFPYQSMSGNGMESVSPPPLSVNPAHSQTIVTKQFISSD